MMYKNDHSFISTGKTVASVTTVLMVFVPSRKLFDRVEKHFGSWQQEKSEVKRQNFDMDIMNIEFGCAEEILVLPKVYGTIDSEYNESEKLFQILKGSAVTFHHHHIRF